MAHNIESMDNEEIDTNFDNKENAFHHNSMLPITPSTEKGYEELDVSELNIKLRYSVTPASSPMSKSFTAICTDGRDGQNNQNTLHDFGNVIQSQNIVMQSDNAVKTSNVMPLQLIKTDQVFDSNRNTSVLRPLNTTFTADNVNITMSVTQDDNISLPSSSSSLVHTPEATTPTKEAPKHEGGSPILRGIKSVLNMFRSSQSPIMNSDDAKSVEKQSMKPQNDSPDYNKLRFKNNLASTPFKSQDDNDPDTFKRSSPHKESMTFNDDLEKELQWSDESCIYFDDEKIPIHKLIYQKPQICCNKTNITKQEDKMLQEGKNLNETVENMDISYNSILSNNTITDWKEEKQYTTVDSDNEFLDCETTFTKNEAEISKNKSFTNLQASPTEALDTEIKYNQNELSSDLEPLQIKQDLNITKEIIESLPTNKEQNITPPLEIKLAEIPFSPNTRNVQIEKLSEEKSKDGELIIANATKKLNIYDSGSEATQKNTLLEHIHTDEVDVDSDVGSIQTIDVISSHTESSDLNTIRAIVDYDQLNNKNTEIKDNAKLNKNNATVNLNISDNRSEATQSQDTLLEHVHTVEVGVDLEVTSNQTISVISSHPESSNLNTIKVIVDNDLLNNINTNIKDYQNLNLQNSLLSQTNATENLNISDNVSDASQLQNTLLEHVHTVEVGLDSEVKSNQTVGVISSHLVSSDLNPIKVIVDNDPLNNSNTEIKDNQNLSLQNYILSQTNATENFNISHTTQLQSTLLEHVHTVEVDLDSEVRSNQTIDISSCPESFALNNIKVIVNNDLLNNINTKIKNNENMQSSIHEQALTKENIETPTTKYEKNIIQVDFDSPQPVDVPLPDDDTDEKPYIESNEVKNEHFIPNLNLSLNTITSLNQENNYGPDDNEKKSDCCKASMNSIVPELEAIELQYVEKEHHPVIIENLAELEDADVDLTKTKNLNEGNKCVKTINLLVNNLVNDNKIQEKNKCDSQFLLMPDIISDSLVTSNPIKSKDTFPIIPEQSLIQVQANKTNAKYTLKQQMGKDETGTLSGRVTDAILDNVVGEAITPENNSCNSLEQINNKYTLEHSTKINDLGTPKTQMNHHETVALNYRVVQTIPDTLIQEAITTESNNLLQQIYKNGECTSELEIIKDETILQEQALVQVQSDKTNETCTLDLQNNIDETVTQCHKVTGEVPDKVDGDAIKSGCSSLYMLEQSNKKNGMGTPDPQVNKAKFDGVAHEILAQVINEPVISENTNIYALEQLNKTNKIATQNHRVTHEVLSEVNAEMQQTNDIGTLSPQSNEDETPSLNDGFTHEFVVEVDAKVTKPENKNFYGSLAAEIVKTELKSSETNDESSVPSSPPIKSRGYNFNFDELDDQFITNTRIDVTPPTISNSKTPKPAMKTILEKTKKDANRNRRSVQPIKKKMTANTSKSNKIFDDKFNTGDKLVNDIEDQENPYCREAQMSNEILLLKQTENDPCNTTKVLENTFVEENNAKFDVTVVNPSENNLLSENPVKSEVNNIDITNNAASSPLEDASVKNVFNLQKSDDVNFNPFSTKCKLTESIPDTFNKGISTLDNVFDVTENCDPIVNTQVTVAETFNIELCNKENAINTTCSSKESDNKDSTVREVHTEDEDTEEGPFLEANEVLEAEKLTNFYSEKDMIRFSDVHQAPTVPDEGELFIDAQAFEFLMNQNANEVADSGKESLFLKFDPLFSRRVGSDGIVSALSNLPKKQSTPRKASKSPDLHYNESFDLNAVAASSTFNLAHNNTITEENNDVNITISKPMMAVPPAVNPVALNRNKASTPTRTNRHSMTFASPAIAMIDRLLSMSGNTSYVSQDTTMTTQANEADLALLQLREVLAQKEEQVLNLRIESEELKDRLANLESQMRGLEAESEDRLKKVNELTEKLGDKTKENKSMATVVEEYERTIASLIAETEQEKKLHAEERLRLISERNEQTAHLASMEVSFSDLHSKYEKSKQMILGLKSNEETYEKSMKEFEENYNKMLSNYELLKQHATSKLNHANQELEKIKKAHNAEVMKLNAMIKRKDMHITSLEETLAQKTKANEELTAICDELINKVG